MGRTCATCGFAGPTTWKRGLCNRCYMRAYKAGTLDRVARASRGPVAVLGSRGEDTPQWKGNDATYNGVHKRIGVQRGRAAASLCAEDCGRQAEHWSYDGYCPAEKYDGTRRCPYCPHVEHYQARCRPCHSRWDRDQDIVAVDFARQ